MSRTTFAIAADQPLTIHVQELQHASFNRIKGDGVEVVTGGIP